MKLCAKKVQMYSNESLQSKDTSFPIDVEINSEDKENKYTVYIILQLPYHMNLIIIKRCYIINITNVLHVCCFTRT